MFGIAGLDPFGLLHALFGLAALGLGLWITLLDKGTPLHRRLGRVYVIAMVCLNGTALMIYDLFGRFGPFHVAALISLATILAGFGPVLLRRPRNNRIELHAYFMAWSYVGLVGGTAGEIAVRVPGWDFAIAALVSTTAAIACGAVLVHTRVPRILLRFMAPRAG